MIRIDTPNFRAPAVAPSESRGSGIGIPGTGIPQPKILIVDDRGENLVALRRALKDVDAEIVEAADGNEALIATLDHDFALAILDVQMPGMDGYELAGLLRGDPRTSRLPIIFLTAAYGEDEQVFKGYEAGAVDYIVKPYNLMVLLAKVNIFLELKRLQENLTRRAQDLAAANSELESFSYSVSHDLRAPLRSIGGFCSIVLEDYADKLDAQGQNYLARIMNGADKMEALIDDLLELSRISHVEMMPWVVDLSALAGKVVQELRQTEPQKEVEILIEDQLSTRGDQRLLKIVLSNLIGNAWKYTGQATDARIEFGLIEQNGQKVYYVRDNGTGFDMLHAAKLFKPFQRLHSESEFAGTGIGLAIVNRIIQRHNGQIWAQSEAGMGATFFFSLPSVITE